MKQQKFKLHSVEDIGGIYATAGDIPVDERTDASDRTIYHIFFVEDPGELWMTFYDGDESAPAICVMGKVAFENLTSDQKELLRGPRGFKGEKGDKMTLADLTEEEIATLRGRDGEKGEKGDKGDKGDRGDKGMRGDTGLPGEKGEKGEKGDKGDRGEKGEKGDKGDRGERGEKGERGVRGYIGRDGEKGEKGEKGDKGDKGDRGEKGDKGDKGDQGEKGEKGDMGHRGPKGDRGMQGNSGVMLDNWDIVEIINELNLDIKEYGPEAILSANVGLSLQNQINTVTSNKVYLTEEEYDALVAQDGLVVGKEYNVYEE